ncbi:DUF6401 family natural product biosynthesis protein [Nocardia aurantia]|uniref:Uncharacterized protein n=1 Tax=Nocardia aurantia TaxID=2585199 RepID=A0A7K0DRW4_9NOCA|nr:DUF6401 family natural product biosynthesis protein [Nocardia aurantia]MQY28489.1 hypothetical protein [Nocardia aurantia]
MAEVAARKTLSRLQLSHGNPAADAAKVVPALSATLDQHAAAVRDILDFGIENSTTVPVTVLLAGYARGLVEHAGHEAVRAPHDAAGWAEAGWLPMRLAAVCLLAPAPRAKTQR